LCLTTIQLQAAETGGLRLKAGLGFGMALKNNLRFDNDYINLDRSTVLSSIPMVMLFYGPISLGQNGLNLGFIGNRDRSAFLNFNRYGERYYGPLMDRRKESWFGSLGVKWDEWALVLGRDLMGRSQGIRSQLSYTYVKNYDDQSMLRASAFLEFLDGQFVNYYYGVRAHEVNAWRSIYTPGATFIPGMGLFYAPRFFEHLSLNLGAVLKYIPSEIKKSPTTKGTDFETTMIAGAMWNFN